MLWPAVLVLALAAGATTSLRAAPKRRVLVAGFSGNASSTVKQHATSLVMSAAQAVVPQEQFPVVGCGEIHATLEGLGRDPDDCYAGRLTRDDLETLFPKYVLTGEVMAVGDTHYVTVRIMDASKRSLEVVTIRVDPRESAASKGSRGVRRALDRRLRRDGITPRSWVDDGKVELGVEDNATKGADVAQQGPAPTPAPTPQPTPGRVDPPPPAATAPRPAPQPSTPRVVGVFFTQRFPRSKDFAWDARSTSARDVVHQTLKAQGAEAVDVVNVGGPSAGRLRQDGAVASDTAASLFQDARLTDGLAVRVVWTPTGDPSTPEYHVNIKVVLHPKSGKVRRVVREHTLVCGDPNGAQCQRQVKAYVSGAVEKVWQSG